MVTIICQHSGLEVEAATKRTKQHPRIAGFKDQASKDGTYREADNALAEARKRGGYTNIDEYMNLVNAIMSEYREAARAKHDRIAASIRKEEEQRAQIKAQREARNAKLKAAGYKWSKYEPDQDSPFDDRPHWDLFSPDGRLVTEQQALDEIERGADVVKAEMEAKQRAEASEKARIEQAVRAAEAAFDAQVEQIERENQRVERIEFPVSETIRIQWPKDRQHSYYRHIDKIQRGQINGVNCWRITTNSGYDDDGYDSYYCADPTAAGAKVYTPTNNLRNFLISGGMGL